MKKIYPRHFILNKNHRHRLPLTAFITISLSKLEKEHYTPTDTPNERFMVGGQHWQDFVDNPQEL